MDWAEEAPFDTLVAAVAIVPFERGLLNAEERCTLCLLMLASGVAPIPYERLALCLLPVALVCFLLFRTTREGKAAVLGLSRMVLQLSLVGYVLVAIFNLQNPWSVFAILAVMMVAGGWIALRHLGSDRSREVPRAVLAILLGAGSVLALVTQFVLDLDPWYAPRQVIPLAGMAFANSMNSISLAAERFHREMLSPAVPGGSTAAQSGNYHRARSEAFRAGMIPSINSLLAVGLVSLPGMMTGQILSGVSPMIAARYQILVMCMLFGASGLSIAAYLCFGRPPSQSELPRQSVAS